MKDKRIWFAKNGHTALEFPRKYLPVVNAAIRACERAEQFKQPLHRVEEMIVTLMYSNFRRDVQDFWRNRRGVAAIEFAITLPILLCIALGSIDLVSLAQTRQGAAALAVSSCAAGGRAGFIVATGLMDFPKAIEAATQSFEAGKAKAFMTTMPAATLNVGQYEEFTHFIKCDVTIVWTPLVGFINNEPKTFTASAVD